MKRNDRAHKEMAINLQNVKSNNLERERERESFGVKFL